MSMLGTTLQIKKRDRPWVDKSILRTKFTLSLMATIRDQFLIELIEDTVYGLVLR